MRRLLILATLFAFGCDAECLAQVYKMELYDARANRVGVGSATCIGIPPSDGRAVLLTSRHSFRDSSVRKVIITDETGKRVTVKRVRQSFRKDQFGEFHDVAACEVYGGTFKRVRLANTSTDMVGRPVSVCGFGEVAYKSENPQMCFMGTVNEVTSQAGKIEAEAGVIPGDSGGAVYLTSKSGDMCLVGLVQGYQHKNRRDRRTRFVPTTVLCQNIRQWYNDCPQCQQIPPQPQQWQFQVPARPQPTPRIVIPRQVTPRRVITPRATPIPAPIISQPAPAPAPSAPVVVEQKSVDPNVMRRMIREELAKIPRPKNGNDGATGPRGPAGPAPTAEALVPIVAQVVGAYMQQNPPKDGVDGKSVTQDQVEQAVNGWLNANREALRGTPGESVSKDEVRSMVRQMWDENRTQLVTLPSQEEIDQWNKAWIAENRSTLIQGLLSDPSFRQGLRQMLEADVSVDIETVAAQVRKTLPKLAVEFVDGSGKRIPSRYAYQERDLSKQNIKPFQFEVVDRAK